MICPQKMQVIQAWFWPIQSVCLFWFKFKTVTAKNWEKGPCWKRSFWKKIAFKFYRHKTFNKIMKWFICHCCNKNIMWCLSQMDISSKWHLWQYQYKQEIWEFRENYTNKHSSYLLCSATNGTNGNAT